MDSKVCGLSVNQDEVPGSFKFKKWLGQIACLVAAMMVLGCDSRKTELKSQIEVMNSSNIDRLRNAYELFVIGNDQTGPQDQKTLVNFLISDRGAATRLGRMGVSLDKINELFVSERDKQAFRIRWGVSDVTPETPIVFEAKGVDGQKMVAYSPAQPLSAEKADALWQAAIAEDTAPSDEPNTETKTEGSTENPSSEPKGCP